MFNQLFISNRGIGNFKTFALQCAVNICSTMIQHLDNIFTLLPATQGSGFVELTNVSIGNYATK